MEPISWAICLMLAGLILLAGELFLPTHGVLGVMGAMCILGCVVACFVINKYLGTGALVAVSAASPFVVALALKIYPYTPVGRKMMLQPVESRLHPPTVRVGDTGQTLSELRPMGLCEFSGDRVEVRSEYGIIPARTAVRVVNVDAGRLIVRAEPAVAAATNKS